MRKIWTLEPHHCRKCKKEIYITPEWVYKDGWGVYCSWKCFNHRFDRKTTNEKKYHYKPIEQLEPDGVTVVETYKNAYDAMAAIDGTVCGVRDACRKGNLYKKYLWRYAENPTNMKEVLTLDDKQTVETDICESTKSCD